jgi:hypothetical protein
MGVSRNFGENSIRMPNAGGSAVLVGISTSQTGQRDRTILGRRSMNIPLLDPPALRRQITVEVWPVWRAERARFRLWRRFMV